MLGVVAGSITDLRLLQLLVQAVGPEPEAEMGKNSSTMQGDVPRRIAAQLACACPPKSAGRVLERATAWNSGNTSDKFSYDLAKSSVAASTGCGRKKIQTTALSLGSGMFIKNTAHLRFFYIKGFCDSDHVLGL